MNLVTSPAPHIHGKESKQRLMLDVIIALLPALLAGVLVYGLRALWVTLICVAASALSHLVFRILAGAKARLDLSAVVTGMLLAMILPASVPYWLALIGSVFAAAAVKGFASIGNRQCLLNPALLTRVLMVLLFPVALFPLPVLPTRMILKEEEGSKP